MSERRPIRVLLVAAATSTTGGGERHVADLVRMLPARGIDLGLVTPSGGDLSALAGLSGVPFHHAEIASGLSFAGHRQLHSAIETFKPDIVHAHGSRAALYARSADGNAVNRCVYTLHGIHYDHAGRSLRRTALLGVDRWLKRRTAHFITVCDADRRKGARLGVLDQPRTTTVYNGIEPPAVFPARSAFRSELGITDDVPLTLSIGRFHAQKDQSTLLRAWALVRERVPDAVLALVGAGELDAALHSLARELRLGDAMRFVETRPDPASAYTGSDVFCLSSLWEGLPYAVLEAMAYGLPVVSTDVDGIPEAVAHGMSGLLVPPADPASLASAIIGLLGDAALRRQMGEAGAAVVAERFGLARMADELVDVYHRVAGR